MIDKYRNICRVKPGDGFFEFIENRLLLQLGCILTGTHVIINGVNWRVHRQIGISNECVCFEDVQVGIETLQSRGRELDHILIAALLIVGIQFFHQGIPNKRIGWVVGRYTPIGRPCAFVFAVDGVNISDFHQCGSCQ